MIVTYIDWLDKNNKEAAVTVSDLNYNIICFSDNLKYKIGDEIRENLIALDINDVKKISNNNHCKVKMNNTFDCQIIGKLFNDKSAIKIGKICIDISGCYIPNDLKDNDIIEARLSRVDLY